MVNSGGARCPPAQQHALCSAVLVGCGASGALLNHNFSSEQRDGGTFAGQHDVVGPFIPSPKLFPTGRPSPLLQEMDLEEPARADVSASSARILKSGQSSKITAGVAEPLLSSG